MDLKIRNQNQARITFGQSNKGKLGQMATHYGGELGTDIVEFQKQQKALKLLKRQQTMTICKRLGLGLLGFALYATPPAAAGHFLGQWANERRIEGKSLFLTAEELTKYPQIERICQALKHKP